MAEEAEALGAVDGPVSAGQERDLRSLVAALAYSGVHLSWGAAAETYGGAVVDVAIARGTVACLASVAAGWAAGWGVDQALVCVEGLLANAEVEAASAIATDNDPVGVWHLFTLLFNVANETQIESANHYRIGCQENQRRVEMVRRTG